MSGLPVASLSLDLDNQWSYLKTRGDRRWESYPSYLDVVVPIALDVFATAGVRATFFVVGADAEREPAAVVALAGAGHEIGNHSFSHEPWLHRFDAPRLEEEIDRTGAAIAAAGAPPPVGFRGPGYSLTPAVLALLVDRGYRYDASTLPTWIGPVARAWYFRQAALTPEERADRAELFGSARNGRQRLRPYRWAVADGSLIEIPVTTFPGLRVPMHLSYVLALAGRSRRGALAFFRSALAACRVAGVEPSLLLHPLDLLGADDLPASGLEFFPGMAASGAVKRDLVGTCLRELTRRFATGSVGDHAALAASRPLPLRPGPR